MQKITIFLTVVLVLFTSCARKIENCKILPKVELESAKKDESVDKKQNTEEKIRNILENRKTSAEISCKF